jgi:hypothetical protein
MKEARGALCACARVRVRACARVRVHVCCGGMRVCGYVRLPAIRAAKTRRRKEGAGLELPPTLAAAALRRAACRGLEEHQARVRLCRVAVNKGVVRGEPGQDK